MIELFSRRKPYFFKSTLGIHSLAGHFRKMEKDLEQIVLGQAEENVRMDTNAAEAAHRPR